MEEEVLLYHFEHGRGRPILVIHGGPGIPPYHPWEGLKIVDKEYHVYYYHQRGCGNSSRPVDRFGSQNYSENMLALDCRLGMAVQLVDIERIRQILNQDRLILIDHSPGRPLSPNLSTICLKILQKASIPAIKEKNHQLSEKQLRGQPILFGDATGI